MRVRVNGRNSYLLVPMSAISYQCVHNVVNDGKRLFYSTLCIYCICNLFTTYGMYKLCAYIYYD